MIKAPPTPKGFRDILPELAKKRREVINTIANILEESGFFPIETPTIEFAETLKGKYGEEEKLIYEFTDRGGRDLALRYDLTVPLARFVASNLNLIQKGPLRRYQIGQVFRGEKPQKGRWREFTQFDFDSVGSKNLEEDAKVIAGALSSIKKLNMNGSMRINDRNIFKDYNLSKKAIIELDKIDKEGPTVFVQQLGLEGLSRQKADDVVKSIMNSEKTESIKTIFSYLEKIGYKEGSNYDFWFDATLARGLDYYTSTIFELRVPQYGNLSVGGGGRYDNLIGMFANKQIPAVGFSFGLDRLIEAMEQKNVQY